MMYNEKKKKNAFFDDEKSSGEECYGMDGVYIVVW